jgi:CubicO group peptidase (beta-lactamase class C family)
VEEMKYKLEEYLKEAAGKDEFSGVVLIKQGERELYEGAFGYANRTWKIPPNRETKFRIASLSKIFTAVVIGQMIDVGKLALTDSVVEILELTNTTISEDVTIVQLMTHTSGIGDYFDEMNASDDAWVALWKEKPIYQMRKLEDYFEMFKNQPAVFLPGEKFQYCGAGYILLGMVIEKIKKKDYRLVIQEEIFERVELHNTLFQDNEDVIENVADGYEPEEDADGNILGWKKNIYTMTPVPAADGGVTSTTDDLIQFYRALRTGQLMSEKMTALFLEPQVVDQDSDGHRGYQWQYGFANWFLLKAGEIIRMGHTGEEFGVSARYYYYPKEEIEVVLLGNQGFCMGSVGWRIHDLLLGQEK